MVRPWDSLRKPNCVKVAYGGNFVFGQIYTKNTNFGDFGGCKPTFLKYHSDEVSK